MRYNTYKMEEALDSLIDYRGKTPQKSDSGIETLSARSVRDGFIDYSQCYYISKEEYDRFMVRGFPKVGDVLLTTEAPLGVIARLDRADVAIAQRLLTLRGKEGVLDTGYLYYYLRSPIGQAKLIERQTGTTVTGIKQAEFRKIEIIIPDISYQRKVTAILQSIDEKIVVNKQINENLEQQAATLISEYCVSTSDYIPLGEIMSFENGFAFQSKTYLSVGQYRIITIKNVQDGKIDSQGAAYINDVPPRMKSGCFLVIGDVLLSLTGNVGRAGIVCEENLLLNQRVAKIAPTDYTILPWLYYYFRLPSTKTALETIAKGTAQQNLSPVETLKLQVPFEMSSAKALSQLLYPMFRQEITNERESLRLANLRDTLLPRLMSGELDVSELDL